MKHLIFVLLLIPLTLMAKEPKTINISPPLNNGLVCTVANNWQYKFGDNPDWANPDFDASSWKTFTYANLYNMEIQKKQKKSNIIWYRKKLLIDSTTTQNIVAFITQSGASEIYIDGKLIHTLGKVSSNPDSIVCTNQSSVQFPFPMKTGKEQLLAVRFATVKKKLPQFPENTGFLTFSVQREDFANQQLLVASDSLFDSYGILNLGNRNGWRFNPGDDLKWAKPDFDDSDWKFYMPSILTEPIPDSLWNSYGWFRYRFDADSSIYAIPVNLYFSTYGAAEVYLDGKLVWKFGRFSTDPKVEKLFNPNFKTHPSVVLHQGGTHVLAVRYSYHKGPQYKKILGEYAGIFGFYIGLATDDLNQLIISDINNEWQLVYILGTMLFLIVLLHGFLFALFPTERSNLYIAIVALLLLLIIIAFNVNLLFEPDILWLILIKGMLQNVFILAIVTMIPFTINSMFNQRPRVILKLLIWLFPAFALANFILSGSGMNLIIIIIIASVVVLFSSQVLIQARRNKQKGVWIVAGTFFGMILCYVAFILYFTFSQNFWNYFGKLLVYMAFISFPLGLTAFMASRFRDLYAHLEQKVIERTRALNQSLEDLRSTQSQLIQSEKMASLGVLTAGIAHEIQNPLNFVNNFSEVNAELIDEALDENDKGNHSEVKLILNDLKENESKIIHHGKRADAIVKGMLQHSRATTGHKEPTDINALADEYLRLSYHGMRAKDKSFNAEYKTEFDPNLPKINVIPQEIGRVLLNLINNAFYAVQAPPPPERGIKERGTDYKPTVIVRTSSWNPPSGGRGACISVIDNGPGIPANIVDKIFQPFFTTKPTGQGTGLGLSLAYDIVKAHGGEIKVETKIGEGTEFIIEIPIKTN